MALIPRVPVDDNPALVDNLRETLEDEGYAVATAARSRRPLKEAAAGVRRRAGRPQAAGR